MGRFCNPRFLRMPSERSAMWTHIYCAGPSRRVWRYLRTVGLYDFFPQFMGNLSVISVNLRFFSSFFGRKTVYFPLISMKNTLLRWFLGHFRAILGLFRLNICCFVTIPSLCTALIADFASYFRYGDPHTWGYRAHFMRVYAGVSRS